MKKNHSWGYPINFSPLPKKLVRIMKLSILLTFVLTVNTMASIYSQMARFDFEIKDQTVRDVLKTIEKGTQFRFFYNDEFTDLNKKLTFSARDKSIDELLSMVLDKTEVSYKVMENNFVVITPRSLMQERIVTGTVTDAATGEPLPGVNILIEGTLQGVITDASGKYSINVEDQNLILIFSYIGFITEKVPISGQSIIDVTLSADITQLEEVVVIGYGSARKSDLTGSAEVVGNKDFNKGLSSLSPEKLIQGKVAGLLVINNSGAPGGEMTMRIRGTGSVRSGNQPLFVVDGVPLDGRDTQPSVDALQLGSTTGTNPLNFLNSNDIESITILKDASSTAIFGSRGANGVVIITTKRGKAGAPRVDFSMSGGISNMLRDFPERMDAAQFRQAISDRGLTYGDGTSMDGGASTNALKEITHTAKIQNYNMALSGGNEKGSYRVSIGYNDNQGIIKKSDFKRYAGSFSGGYNFLKDDRLHVDVNLNATNTIINGVAISTNANAGGSLMGNVLAWNPTIPLRYADGSYVQENYVVGTVQMGVPMNPLALIDYFKDRSDVTNILANISPRFRIIDGLEYKFTLGVNQSKSNRTVDQSGELFMPQVYELGSANFANSMLRSIILNHVLNFKKSIGANLNLDAMLGYEYQNYQSSVYNMGAFGFSSFDVLGSQIFQNASVDHTNISSYTDPTTSLQSFFSRVNLNLFAKFLITATIRADGSSKFGANNKYGYFPSIAGAWILSEEEFIPDVFNNLKFRVSYGKTGNSEFPTGAAQERYVFGRQTVSLNNVANPDLKWESTVTNDFGIDFGLMKNRLSGTVDYFNRTTKDLLFLLPTVQPAPQGNYWVNLPAEIVNRGTEISLRGIILQKSNLSWDLSINASFMKSELTNYYGAPVLTGNINGSGLANGFPCQRLVNNQPMNVFYMVRFEGLDEDGEAMYSDGRDYVGDPNPKTLLGISSDLNIGKLTVNLGLNGAFGYKIYNNTTMVNLSPTNLASGLNATPEIGLSNESLTNANVISTRYLEDGDFLKLSSAGISYNIGSFHDLKNISVSITGNNLLLFTKYKGNDPEVNTNKSVGGVPSFGIDNAGFPSARTIMMGINVSF